MLICVCCCVVLNARYVKAWALSDVIMDKLRRLCEESEDGCPSYKAMTEAISPGSLMRIKPHMIVRPHATAVTCLELIRPSPHDLSSPAHVLSGSAGGEVFLIRASDGVQVGALCQGYVQQKVF